MGKIYRYLLGSFFKTFIRYFAVLFFLVSVMYFIRISKFTSFIDLDFYDISVVYLLFIPQIVIYTLPLTYFIALVNTLTSLSKDGEILVLFTLGKEPSKVVSLYLIISFLVALLLMFNSLVLIPLSDQQRHNYLNIKSVESKLNIKTSEVGQKIGNWNIFSNSETKHSYEDIILFQYNKNGSNKLILAKKASLENKSKDMILKLSDGKYFNITKQAVNQTDFEKLTLVDKLSKDELENKTLFEYWSEIKHNDERLRWFSEYIMMSIFPILSVFIAFSIGIFNQRTQKRSISIWIGVFVILYYGFSFKLAEISPIVGEVVFAFLYLVVTYMIYYRVILKRY